MVSKRFKFHGQSRFDLYSNRENSVHNDSKIHEIPARRSTSFPFLSRFLSHWYARFGVSGDSSRGGFGKSGCVGTFIGVAEASRGRREIA